MTMCTAMMLVMSAAATATTTISVAGTANETNLGYNKGESYTFYWTVSDTYTGSYTDGFYNMSTFASNRWCAENTSDPYLIINAGGDGLNGTYTRSIISEFSPHEFLDVSTTGGTTWLGIGVRDDSYTTIGLTASGVAISYLAFNTNDAGTGFAYPGAFSNPASYLSTHTGDFMFPGIDSYNYIRMSSGSEGIFLEFTVASDSSYSIHTVPEPSTITMLGLGVLLLRRKPSFSRSPVRPPVVAPEADSLY